MRISWLVWCLLWDGAAEFDPKIFTLILKK